MATISVVTIYKMESLYKRRWRDSNQITETNSQLSFNVGEVITVRQLPVYETSSVGLTVWDSVSYSLCLPFIVQSFVMMKYLERNCNRFRAKNAIELGTQPLVISNQQVAEQVLLVSLSLL